jgi:hypothetical protein
MTKKRTPPSNTATKQAKPRKMPKGKQFVKNDPITGEKDERINRKGRPKSFDQLRALGQQLAEEISVNAGKPLLAPDGQPMTQVEAIMRQMMQDEKQRLDFLYITYGKPSERREVTGKDGSPLGSAALDMQTIGKYLSDGDLIILQQAAEIIERAQRTYNAAILAAETGD